MLKQYNQIKNAGPVQHETGGASLDCRDGVSLLRRSGVSLNCSGGVSLTGISSKYNLSWLLIISIWINYFLKAAISNDISILFNYFNLSNYNFFKSHLIISRSNSNDIYSVSYTHLPSPRDRTRSRMPSSA